MWLRVVEVLRSLKARTLRFRHRHRPIVIFGLRRGGSTMVADAIIASPGVWFANEPYAVLSAHPAFALKRRRLPPARHSHYFGLRDRDLDLFESYTRDLLMARLPEVGTCRRTRPLLRADRVCLKVLNAPWMIDWFARSTDAQILTLLRHPGAQALSVLRQGWGLPVEAYLERQPDLEGAFSAAQLDFARGILQGGDPWRKAILDWVVTSHPLRRAEGPEIVHARYEDIVLDPETFVDQVLTARFGLEDRARMLAAFGKPSGSSRMSEGATLEAIQGGRRDSLIRGWHRRTDADMRRNAQEILETFQVSGYSFTD